MIKNVMCLVTILLTLLTTSAHAQEARAIYTETSVGGGLWRYNYTFYNDLNPITFVGFDLYDINLTLDGATIATNELTAPLWSSIITVDFVEYFSVLSGPPPVGGDVFPGASIGGFQFLADKQLGDLAFTATFTDPSDPFTPRFYAGISQNSSSTSAPEPATGILLLCGISGFGLLCCRRG